MSWTYHVAPPFAAIAFVVFCALEPQVNNIFFRSPTELEIMNLFPIDWEVVILAKNTAALIIISACLIVTSAALAFFAPEVYGFRDILDGILYCATVLFPLLSIGNANSVSNARRKCGWQYDDLMEILWMAITLLLLSIPYVLMHYYLNYAFIYFVYGVAVGYYWYKTSIPNSAKHLMNELITLCDKS